MDIVKIENHDNLVRDLESKAILNTSMAAADQYQRQRKIMEDSKTTRQEIDSIKEQLSDVKTMLDQILRKLTSDSAVNS